MNRLTKMATILAIALLAFLPVYAGAGPSSQKDDNYQYDQNYSGDNQSNYYSDDNSSGQYSDDQQSDNYQNNDSYYDQNNNYSEDNNYQGNYNENYSDNEYAPSGQADYNSTLNNYGEWVNVAPFGRAWRPMNVSADWRPFSDGHWVTTSYGPTWEGYEPYAWATYHYGNWIYSAQYGWVWIPGTTYTPGNVAWSYGPDSIGWMPAPPYGYDYSRGYLSYVGPVNQFSFSDSGFGFSFGFGSGYYPAAYQPLFFSPAYVSICPNLWFFMNRSYFTGPNYAGHYLGPGYVRNVFVQKNVRINSRPIQRDVLQRIVQRPLPVVSAHERTINLNGHQTKFVDLVGHAQRVNQNERPEFRNMIRTRPANPNTRVQQEKQQDLRQMERQARPNDNRQALQNEQRNREFNPPRTSQDQVRVPTPERRPDFRAENPTRDFHMENGRPTQVSVAPPREMRSEPQRQPEVRQDTQRDRQRVEDARQTNNRNTPKNEQPTHPKKPKNYPDHRPPQ